MAKKLVKEHHLFIDFENVQQIDPSKLNKYRQVSIFVGINQKKLPTELVCGTQNINWHMIEGNGKNALDFHIAYYLGCEFAQSSEIECIILSKDSGFDPLVQHLNKNGLVCRRINNLSELEPSKEKAPVSNYEKLLDSLIKNGKSKPGCRTKLANYISSIFQKKLPVAEIDQLIDRLCDECEITVTGETLTYNL